LFSSSELAEVMAMADRIVVMAKGRITGQFSADQVTEEQLVTASASDQILESIR
jgi:erythritol transport system ATP-binding protein